MGQDAVWTDEFSARGWQMMGRVSAVLMSVEGSFHNSGARLQTPRILLWRFQCIEGVSRSHRAHWTGWGVWPERTRKPSSLNLLNFLDIPSSILMLSSMFTVKVQAESAGKASVLNCTKSLSSRSQKPPEHHSPSWDKRSSMSPSWDEMFSMSPSWDEMFSMSPSWDKMFSMSPRRMRCSPCVLGGWDVLHLSYEDEMSSINPRRDEMFSMFPSRDEMIYSMFSMKYTNNSSWILPPSPLPAT